VSHLWREAGDRGLSRDRIRFAERRPLPQHLSRLQLADMCVDTFPYTSHTTGSDILRAGVPLVTRIGETFVSRVAASLLYTLGVPELVADSWPAYTDICLDLARHPDKLTRLKEKITHQQRTSALFDTDRFTRDLERLYQRMWDDHLAGRRDVIALDAEASRSPTRVWV
jgi:predicted O-linked N-acetylglucosamine transferase (SPINDLY family)